MGLKFLYGYSPFTYVDYFLLRSRGKRNVGRYKAHHSIVCSNGLPGVDKGVIDIYYTNLDILPLILNLNKNLDI